MTDLAVDHTRVRTISAALNRLDQNQREKLLLHLVSADHTLPDRIEAALRLFSHVSGADPTASELAMERHVIGSNPLRKRIQSTFPLLKGKPLALEIQSQISQIKEALAEDRNDWALLMLDGVTEYCIEILPGLDVYSHLGGMDMFFARLEPLWIEALLSVKLKEDRERARWQKILNLYRKHASPFAVDDVFALAGETVLRGWRDPVLRQLLASSFEVNDHLLADLEYVEPELITQLRLRVLERHHCYDAYLNLARATQQHSLYLLMLVNQHRFAESASEAIRLLHDQASMLELVLALSHMNADRYAMYVATRGLKCATSNPDLALWVCETALRSNDRPLAFKAALTAFEQVPTYDTYSQIHNLLTDDWPDLKPGLDAIIESRELPMVDRIAIHLDTEDLETVLRLVEAHDIPTEMLRTVIRTTMLKHPNWSILKARERADRIMDSQQVTEWPFAFELLTMIKTAHERTGRTREWEWYLENLMIRHEDKTRLLHQLQNFY